MSEIDSRMVEVGTWRLNTLEAGDPGDPTILWLHGSGPGVSARSNWEALMQVLPGYHHVAPDMLGFGDSSHPEDLPQGVGASARLRAETTLQLLDALDIKRAHVVGNSMGGLVSLLMLAQAPERFDRVILMGSAGAPFPPSEDLIKMVLYYQNESPDAMRDLLQRFMYDTATFGDTLDQIANDRAAFAGRQDIKRSHMRTFTPEPQPLLFGVEELAAINHEVLVLHGREDRIIPVAASYYMAEHLPNAQLHVFPHAGHWVHLEQAERFGALAAMFLAEGSSKENA